MLLFIETQTAYRKAMFLSIETHVKIRDQLKKQGMVEKI